LAALALTGLGDSLADVAVLDDEEQAELRHSLAAAGVPLGDRSRLRRLAMSVGRLQRSIGSAADDQKLHQLLTGQPHSDKTHLQHIIDAAIGGARMDFGAFDPAVFSRRTQESTSGSPSTQAKYEGSDSAGPSADACAPPTPSCSFTSVRVHCDITVVLGAILIGLGACVTAQGP
jgi:hypothetical protein